MSNENQSPKYLIVTIADPGALVALNEPITYRTVAIELTPNQMARVDLKSVGLTNGDNVYEFVSSSHLQWDRP